MVEKTLSSTLQKTKKQTKKKQAVTLLPINTDSYMTGLFHNDAERRCVLPVDSCRLVLCTFVPFNVR